MKLHEKIAQLRRQKGLKIKDIHQRLQKVFGKQAVSYRTLLRIEKGQTDGRGSSLAQICLALGVSLKELKEGTEKESRYAIPIKKNRREGKYTYNPRSWAEILSPSQANFIVLELHLDEGGKTDIEKDPEDSGIFEKWLYVLSGKIVVTVANNQFRLSKGDSLYFDSRKPHFFENKSDRRSQCIIIQNPRHI